MPRKQIAESLVVTQKEELAAGNSTICEAVARCCGNDDARVVSSRLFPQRRTVVEFHPGKRQLLIQHQSSRHSNPQRNDRVAYSRSRVSRQNEKSPIQAGHYSRPEIERAQWDSRSTRQRQKRISTLRCVCRAEVFRGFAGSYGSNVLRNCLTHFTAKYMPLRRSKKLS